MFFSKRLLNKRIVVFKNTASATNKLQLLQTVVDKYKALSDTPVVLFYKKLDLLYPNAKFILTVREMSDWLTSCKRHFQPKFTGGLFDQLNYEIYGTTTFDEAKFIETYNSHIADVREYFNGRDDLLEINICAGEGYESLCEFLGIDTPDTAFPQLNSNKT